MKFKNLFSSIFKTFKLHSTNTKLLNTSYACYANNCMQETASTHTKESVKRDCQKTLPNNDKH
jgi:hypothetical protein